MTKPTEAAMRAAEAQAQFAGWYSNEEFGDCELREIATIIDRETGLPELLAKIAELEAEVAAERTERAKKWSHPLPKYNPVPVFYDDDEASDD